MKWMLISLILIPLCGCSKAPPKMAGSKWAGVLRDPDPKARKKAVFTLGNIGPSDPVVLPSLLEALKDANADVRCEAVLALAKYGPGAKEAIPALTEVQHRDRDAAVRAYAAEALEKLKAGG